MCKVFFPYHEGNYCFEDEIKVTVLYPPHRYSGPAHIMESQPIKICIVFYCFKLDDVEPKNEQMVWQIEKSKSFMVLYLWLKFHVCNTCSFQFRRGSIWPPVIRAIGGGVRVQKIMWTFSDRTQWGGKDAFYRMKKFLLVQKLLQFQFGRFSLFSYKKRE